ncbi:MAG: HWE histidine kinase domain-containing protein [Methylocystis sp.]
MTETASSPLPATGSGCDSIHEQSFILERMKLALEAGRTGIWDWNLVTGEVHLDARVRALWGLAPDAPANLDVFRRALHPQDKRRTKEAIEQAIDPNHQDDYESEYRVIGLSDRVERWVSVRGRTFFEDGRAVRIVGTARDITDRKHREQHVRTLLRELVHRSKNLLAVVQAMSRQTARGSDSIEDFQRKFSARLQALSMAHDILISQDWRGASMHELARAQMAYCLDIGAGEVAEHARIDGPKVMLKPEAAQNIGLALHELATNALAYGALSCTHGSIALSWRLEGGRFLVEWRESGGPTVAQPRREGFGHKVIKRLVPQALDGETTLDFPPEGFVWRLSAPATWAMAG